MAADFFSTQLTAIDAGTHLGAGTYKVGGPFRPMWLGTLAFGSSIMEDTEKAAMVRLPKGVIPFQVGILVSVTLATATYEIGIEGTAAKYRADAVHTVVDRWVWHMLATAWDDGPLTAEEEILIEVDTANFPTSGSINMAFECLVP